MLWLCQWISQQGLENKPAKWKGCPHQRRQKYTGESDMPDDRVKNSICLTVTPEALHNNFKSATGGPDGDAQEHYHNKNQQ